MRVGIGVITAGVRQINQNLLKYSSLECASYFYLDVHRRGPAHARNECLHELFERQQCDHVFLFDDDCYPLMVGWERYFLEQHHASGLQFFGLPEAFKGRVVAFAGEILWWDGVIGCFSSQTRECFKQIGYFDTEFQGYGYEDSERHARLRRSGLCGHSGMPSPLRSTSYIFSEDVYARNPTPNLSFEEKQAAIARNRDRFMRECQSTRIYVPYANA